MTTFYRGQTNTQSLNNCNCKTTTCATLCPQPPSQQLCLAPCFHGVVGFAAPPLPSPGLSSLGSAVPKPRASWANCLPAVPARVPDVPHLFIVQLAAPRPESRRSFARLRDRRRRSPGPCGDQSSAPRIRGCPLEPAAARGRARVLVPVSGLDDRRVEVIAYGFPLWSGAQFAVEATIRSLRACVSLRQCLGVSRLGVRGSGRLLECARARCLGPSLRLSVLAVPSSCLRLFFAPRPRPQHWLLWPPWLLQHRACFVPAFFRLATKAFSRTELKRDVVSASQSHLSSATIEFAFSPLCPVKSAAAKPCCVVCATTKMSRRSRSAGRRALPTRRGHTTSRSGTGCGGAGAG